jgi:hypothetical protein
MFVCMIVEKEKKKRKEAEEERERNELVVQHVSSQ